MSKELNNLVKVHQYGIRPTLQHTQTKYVAIQIEGGVGPNEETDTDCTWSVQSLTKPDTKGQKTMQDQIETTPKRTRSQPSISANQVSYLPKRATASLCNIATESLWVYPKAPLLKRATSTQTIELFRHKSSTLYRIANHKQLAKHSGSSSRTKTKVMPTHTIIIHLASEQSLTALRRPTLLQRFWGICNNPSFFLYAMGDSFGYVFIMAFLLSYLIITFSETRLTEVVRTNDKFHT